MPLISSPIDGSPMREIERYGVKIDLCQSSGGVWLDKGELEKIIMMIREEALQESSYAAAPRTEAFDDEADYEAEAPRQRKRHKRDSMFENIMDIFDL